MSPVCLAAWFLSILPCIPSSSFLPLTLLAYPFDGIKHEEGKIISEHLQCVRNCSRKRTKRSILLSIMYNSFSLNIAPAALTYPHSFYTRFSWYVFKDCKFFCIDLNKILYIFKFRCEYLDFGLPVQWLRPCFPVQGSTPGWGTRSYMPRGQKTKQKQCW